MPSAIMKCLALVLAFTSLSETFGFNSNLATRAVRVAPISIRAEKSLHPSTRRKHGASSNISTTRTSSSSLHLSDNLFPFTTTKKFKFSRLSENDDECEGGVVGPIDPLIKDSSTYLRRLNWFSWWSQVILTVVSSVTLLFARAVLKSGSNVGSPVTGGFLFAGCGVSLSFLSIIWTWGGMRLSKRLLKKPNYSLIKVANMIRRTITIGVFLNVIGMLVTLIGAQQIVGLLASKLLSMQGITTFGVSAAAVTAQTLQPLDILVVQANTNLLMSHFISLCCCLIMTQSVRRLDPPSMEDDPR